MNRTLKTTFHRKLEPLVCVILKIAACTHFALFYLINRPHYFSLEQYANGKVELPYQSRILVGWLMRYGAHLKLVQELSRHMPGPPSVRNPYDFLFFLISLLG